jgi:hypothetical protein
MKLDWRVLELRARNEALLAQPRFSRSPYLLGKRTWSQMEQGIGQVRNRVEWRTCEEIER